MTHTVIRTVSATVPRTVINTVTYRRSQWILDNLIPLNVCYADEAGRVTATDGGYFGGRLEQTAEASITA